MGTNSHWLESRKALMGRRRKALEDAGLMDTGRDKSVCEKYLCRCNY